MTPRLPRDLDAITCAQAAAILGVVESTVVRWRREGLLVEQRGGRRLYSRSEVEAVAANPWLTGVQAAEILGVSRVRVSQLADNGRIPVHFTESGQRVYRKAQIAVVAHAREVRARLREMNAGSDLSSRAKLLAKRGYDQPSTPYLHQEQ